MKKRIEKLSPGSVPEILDLWTRAELPCKPRGRDRRELIEARVAEGKDVFFGIRDGEKLVAVVLVTHDGRKGWINRLAVDPEYRGRGFAEELIGVSEEHLRKEGIEIFAALIEDYNGPSLSLFRKCGYVLHRDIYYLSKREHPDV